MKSASCPSPELVQASRMEALPPGVQERVAAHVLGCETCQALSTALDDPEIAEPTPEERVRLRARVRGSVADEPLGAPKHGLRTWFIAAAAVVTGGIVTALVWQFTTSPPEPAGVSLPRLDKPALPARGGLVWRGAGTTAAEELARALEPFNANDFPESARRLDAFVNRYPENPHGHFYLGVSRLFVGADRDAVVALEQAERLARADADLSGDIAWYLALGYARMNQLERAAGTLDRLCRTQHVLAARACTTRREFDTKRR
jgi:cytochrome c-type biogenesis protein CcmH/NrfG